MGHEVGAVARDLRPGGVLIDPPTLGAALRRHGASARPRAGDLTLFEATFSHGGVLVRADVLRREAGVARMVEVKSATEVRHHHVDDIAVQTWVVRGAGRCRSSAWPWPASTAISSTAATATTGVCCARPTSAARVDELGSRVPDWIAGCAATLAGDLPEPRRSEAVRAAFHVPLRGRLRGGRA